MQTDVAIRSILSHKGSLLYTISPAATVFDAIEIMAGKNVGALLVMEDGRLLGVVSERDYTRKVALKGKASKQTSVGEIISLPMIWVTPEHSVEDCMKLMTTNRIRHLPVVENDEVLGVVSIGDLVNWIISAQSQAIQQLENYIVGQYPG
jgi:CBS domain-containing protein